ncbi:TraB/GumN family protein [Chitinibacter fontanus]|uniref:TraB/GumN family protein n=1 Tax=Chitinibacter fontanus TaxID=1737446 RepID=A0A7D5V9A6_9NEIS|nr:TraB/GumN family protein [Chitinibacter fontanus]QLI81311.1 TraB/GumN family protein [Chitinibacter fontanus]
MKLAGRLKIACLTTLLFWAGAVRAECLPEPQVPTAEEIPTLMQQAVDRGFLWKISKGGHASWLYGTIHANQREYWLPGPKTRQAIFSSDAIAVELDITQSETMSEVLRLAQRGAGQVPAQFAERIKAQLVKNCLPVELLDRVHPSLVLSQISLSQSRQDGVEAAFGTEVFLLGAAQGAKKKIIALETPKEQMSALLEDGKLTTAQYQQAMTLMESGQAREQLRMLVDTWARSDLARMERYEEWCECMKTAEDRKAMKRLNDDRNVVLAKRIAQQHGQNQSLFIAVGSLHMVGKKGLPKLLREQGFQVEPISFQ